MVTIDYIDRLKEDILSEDHQIEQCYEIVDTCLERKKKLKLELSIVRKNIKEALAWTNFIHFCQTGKFLDEVNHGEWKKYL